MKSPFLFISLREQKPTKNLWTPPPFVWDIFCQNDHTLATCTGAGLCTFVTFFLKEMLLKNNFLLQKFPVRPCPEKDFLNFLPQHYNISKNMNKATTPAEIMERNWLWVKENNERTHYSIMFQTESLRVSDCLLENLNLYPFFLPWI